MKLREIGEFGFIERFKPMFESLLQTNQTGIGDDCAIIQANDSEEWLVTTDLLVEDVHFVRNAIPADQLGYKSLAVNLSDIAAMGGTPIGSFLSIAIPADVDVEYLDAFLKGYHRLSAKYNTPLMGGDTTRSMKHLCVNVCVIGKCPINLARKRSMARDGDVVCVSGPLGDSAGGLQILLNKLPFNEKHQYLLNRHHKPEPRIHEGEFLSRQSSVNAMMDISDGLASDLVHILKASGVGARIDLSWLPISTDLKSISEKYGWDPVELATTGGEDYELLFTVTNEQFEPLQKAFQDKFDKSLIQIGQIIAGQPEIEWHIKNKRVIKSGSGFNHFK